MLVKPLAYWASGNANPPKHCIILHGPLGTCGLLRTGKLRTGEEDSPLIDSPGPGDSAWWAHQVAWWAHQLGVFNRYGGPNRKKQFPI